MSGEELRALIAEIRSQGYDIHTLDDVLAFLEHRAWELEHGLGPCPPPIQAED
jgi:hypothetical protein